MSIDDAEPHLGESYVASRVSGETQHPTRPEKMNRGRIALLDCLQLLDGIRCQGVQCVVAAPAVEIVVGVGAVVGVGGSVAVCSGSPTFAGYRSRLSLRSPCTAGLNGISYYSSNNSGNNRKRSLGDC